MSNQVVSLEDNSCCTPLTCQPLSAVAAEDAAPLFKALGDPVRLRLLSLIACHEGGRVCVCNFSNAFDLTAPTISHHLKVLRMAGLVDCAREGTWVFYWVKPEVIARLSSLLGAGELAMAGPQ